MPTAREVVAEYLAKKSETDKPKEQRNAAANAAREIVDEMPDGFTAKDVRDCVATMLADVEGLTANRRARAVNQALAGMVADGDLSLEPDNTYAHQSGNVSAMAR